MAGNPNPVLVEVTRGDAIESQHRGAACVFDATGALVHAWGDIDRPVYARSAIKILQALAFLETGAADVCRATFAELALACASHHGEPGHVETARGWLERLGLVEDDLACGAHAPLDAAASLSLAKSGQRLSALHNNCSGKHLAMMATALAAQESVAGYHDPDHPVQHRIRATLADMTGEDLERAPPAIDGCSVPLWGMSLAGLARAMARIADPRGLKVVRQSAIRRLRNAVARNPFMIGGTTSYCTALTARKGASLYVKLGAEGMVCAAVPDLGIGVALKIDDGARRAAEVAVSAVLRYLEALDDADWQALGGFVAPRIVNAAGRTVGEIRIAGGWPQSSRGENNGAS